MMIKPYQLLYLALCFFTLHATVTIVQPRNTNFTNNQLQYAYANFGVIHYGKSNLYSLMVVNQTLCNTSKLPHFNKPTYVVVRGNLSECSYPIKAITAQNLGAQGIIFGSTETKQFDKGVVLADDGNGNKVHITSLFISPEDMQSLQKLKNVQIKVSFMVVKKEKSSLTLFLSGAERSNYIFLRDFRPYYEKLQNSITLDVVYHTFKCDFCDQSECVLARQFCQLDVQNWQFGNGAHIVNEQFRQYNLFKLFSKEGKIDKWFDYMNQFDENCDNDWVNSEICSKNILKSLGVEQNLNIGDQFNTMMEWRRKQISSGVTSFPDATINGLKHQENLTPISVFQMACGSLKFPPQPCNSEQISSSSSKTWIIVLLVLLSIFLLLVGVFCYRRIIRKQLTNGMSTKVNQLVVKYATTVSEQNKRKKEKMMERMTEQI